MKKNGHITSAITPFLSLVYAENFILCQNLCKISSFRILAGKFFFLNFFIFYLFFGKFLPYKFKMAEFLTASPKYQ